MKIDGKQIASEIFEDLRTRVEKIKSQTVEPHLAVILVGEDPASKSYVRQKELKTKEVGAIYTQYNLPETISNVELLSLVRKLNDDKSVHGIIVQRPLPAQIDQKALDNLTTPEKDIDSFHPNSPFPMPLAAAVLKILEEVYKLQARGGAKFSQFASCTFTKKIKTSIAEQENFRTDLSAFKYWLRSKKIVVIGKGQTGGGPTISLLRKMGIEPDIIDSKTKNPVEIAQKADILISAVGKENVVKSEMVKKNAILISVGLHKGADGKLHGDYNEEEIQDIASFYTPTPGGVGPVNVAMLVKNLVDAVQN